MTRGSEFESPMSVEVLCESIRAAATCSALPDLIDTFKAAPQRDRERLARGLSIIAKEAVQSAIIDFSEASESFWWAITANIEIFFGDNSAAVGDARNSLIASMNDAVSALVGDYERVPSGVVLATRLFDAIALVVGDVGFATPDQRVKTLRTMSVAFATLLKRNGTFEDDDAITFLSNLASVSEELGLHEMLPVLEGAADRVGMADGRGPIFRPVADAPQRSANSQSLQDLYCDLILAIGALQGDISLAPKFVKIALQLPIESPIYTAAILGLANCNVEELKPEILPLLLKRCEQNDPDALFSLGAILEINAAIAPIVEVAGHGLSAIVQKLKVSQEAGMVKLKPSAVVNLERIERNIGSGEER